MELTLAHRLIFKEMELSSLLETMRAINANAPEEDLYKIFKFVLTANPMLSRFMLLVNDEQQGWQCAQQHNTHCPQGPFDPEALLRAPVCLGPDSFETVLPIRHKDRLLALLLLSVQEGQLTAPDLNFLEAMTNVVMVAIENKKLARKEEEQKEYAKQLEMARNIQHFLLPKRLPHTPDRDLYASYMPHHTLGGDFYDYLGFPDGRFMLCIADVSGKGLPAAMLMSNFQGGLHALLRSRTPELTFPELVQQLNELVVVSGDEEHFISAFFLVYDPAQHRLRYINAGHNPPLLFLPGQKAMPLHAGTTLLGFMRPLPKVEVGEIEGVDDFFFFAYTDGLIETRDPEGEEFGEQRLEEVLNHRRDMPLQQLHEQLLSSLSDFKQQGSFPDDLTMLSLRVRPS